jgi:hypothetical protein
MKPNFDLIRLSVLAVADMPIGTTQLQPLIDGHSPEEIGFHVHLLIEEGLAPGTDIRSAGHSHECAFISGLTIEGREFANLARDATRWNDAMAEARIGPMMLAKN